MIDYKKGDLVFIDYEYDEDKWTHAIAEVTDPVYTRSPIGGALWVRLRLIEDGIEGIVPVERLMPTTVHTYQFKVGDRVRQITGNETIGYTNGKVGTITEVKAQHFHYRVEFDSHKGYQVLRWEHELEPYELSRSEGSFEHPVTDPNNSQAFESELDELAYMARSLHSMAQELERKIEGMRNGS